MNPFKDLILILCVLLYSICVFAQKQGNIWYFGGDIFNPNLPGAGLDFNSGFPLALTNSGMGYTEGCAVYCNSAGQLLFYSDSENVYDRNHNIMQNGNNMGGHWSTAQSSLIVPVTEDTNKFYIFTNDGHPTSNGTGLHYSIIDMSLYGGLGAVTVVKAISLQANTSEQLIGTKHANGCDFWVITVDYNTCVFYAYQVSNDGISSPIITDLGFNTLAFNNIEMSTKGDKIAIKLPFIVPGTRYLIDFDNSLGTFSNPLDLVVANNANTACSFSPDGNVFYDVIAYLGEDSLYQYNLNASDIVASRITITALSIERRGDMKIGPDDKIYIPKFFSFYLDVIDNPNMVGPGCNFQPNAVFLEDRISGFQLPNESLIANSLQPLLANFGTTSILFVGNLISFIDSSLTNPDSWHWDFGDGYTSVTQNPTHTYAKAGTYNVCLTVTSKGCGTDSLCKTIKIVKENNLFIPNAFTPNKDGENDVFRIIDSSGIKNIYLAIYNRWGEIVFETGDIKEATETGWNGKYKGKESGIAVFVYYLEVEFLDGENKIEKGDITLIR
ncbi:MAG: T9SS type B sorting domain-containing protein [Cytophagales bacterium]|nr:T9SS type B sorting domain-containing protein [Cytophagales bacterium]